jgi:hypothetical protein
VVVHVVVWLMFDVLKAWQAKLDPKPSPMFQQDQKPPAPQLQITPPLDLQKFHAEEQHLLSSYDWVDRSNGIVRIPVTEAMKLLVQRQSKADGQPQTQQSQPAGQDSGSVKQQ